MSNYLSKLFENISEHIPVLTAFLLKVVIALVVFYVGTKVIGWLINLMKKSMNRANVDTGVVQFVGSLAKVILYAILVFSIATNFGVKESSVAALLGTSGLTLGLALQGGLTNLAGGVMILLFKPFVVGDYIMISEKTGVEGTILKIEMFYTTLSTVDNKTIVVPNGTLSNSCVVNVTGKDNRKLEIKVGISYESSIAKAKDILEELLRADPTIQSNEEMIVFVDQLGDHAVVLGLRAWVATEEYWKTKWRLNEQIKLAFDEAGISIPYQQLDVHMKEK